MLFLTCATASSLIKCQTVTPVLPASASKACGETQTREGLAVGLEAHSRAAAWRGLEGRALQCETAVWGPRAGCVAGAELGEGSVQARPGRHRQRQEAPERCGSSLAEQEATIPPGRLKTPGEKTSPCGAELLKIPLNSEIKKQSKEDLDFRAAG